MDLHERFVITMTDTKVFTGWRNGGKDLRIWFTWPRQAQSFINLYGLAVQVALYLNEAGQVLDIELEGLPGNVITRLARRTSTSGSRTSASENRDVPAVAGMETRGSPLRIHVCDGDPVTCRKGAATVGLMAAGHTLAGIDVRLGSHRVEAVGREAVRL